MHERRGLLSKKVAAAAVVAVLLVVVVIAFSSFRPSTSPETTTTFSSQTTALSSQTTTSPNQATSVTTQKTSSSILSSTSSHSSALLKGVSLSPATYDAAGVADFYAKAKQAGSVVEWAGDWEQLRGNGAPAQIAGFNSQNGLSSMIVVQFFIQSTGALIRQLNSSNEQNYLAITADFVKQYKPAYLGVGIEVNILYEKNSTAFNQFVSLFGQVYSEVKADSPSTVVFTIFQLEKMNGLNGGLYGGTNDPSNSEWQLLSMFPQEDIVAFTTYPGLVYQSPSDIPADYYSSIASHTNKSIGFTESGWHTGYIAGGWESSEAEQASFVTALFQLSSSIKPSFIVWSFLYDPNTVVPFSTMGLYYVNGTAKQAWQTWLGAP